MDRFVAETDRRVVGGRHSRAGRSPLGRVMLELDDDMLARPLALKLSRTGPHCMRRGKGVASRFGAALFGLHPGDASRWPDERRRRIEIRVIEVAPRADPRRRGVSRMHASELPCISG